MEFFKDIFIHSYIGAAIWILIGIWFLKSWNKKKLKASVYSDSQRLLGNLYGFAAWCRSNYFRSCNNNF